MENSRSLGYLKAMRKVKALKNFYSHLAVYIIVNGFLILMGAGVFSRSEKVDFTNWEIYVTAFFWGFGLVSHALYVLFLFYFKNNSLKRWEERKIQKYLDED